MTKHLKYGSCSKIKMGLPQTPFEETVSKENQETLMDEADYISLEDNDEVLEPDEDLYENNSDDVEGGVRNESRLSVDQDRTYDSMQYIDDIAFYRDLSNDFNGTEFEEDLKDLESHALQLIYNMHDLQMGNARLTVAVIGNFNSGKSTFINSVLGADVCPMEACPTTSSITTFVYSNAEKIILIDEQREVSQDEYQQMVRHPKGSNERTIVYEFEYSYPFEGIRNIALVDTPGFENSKNPYDTEVTTISVQQADIIIFIMDIQHGEISASTLNILKDVRKKTKADWYIILNKADTKPTNGANKVLEKIKSEYGNLFKNAYLYSASRSLEEIKQNDQKFISKFMISIEEMIKNDQEFDIHIVGKRETSLYTVICDGRKINIPRKRQVGITRDDLYNLFAEFDKNKNYIKFQEHVRSERNYQEKKKSILLQMQRSIQQWISDSDEKSNQKSDRIIQEFEIKVSASFKNLISELNSIMMQVLNRCISAKPISAERKYYLFDPWWELVLSTASIYESLTNSRVWRSVESEYARVARALKEDIGFSSMEQNFSTEIYSLKEATVQDIWSNITYWKNTVSTIECNNAEEAQQLKSSLIEKMLSDISNLFSHYLSGYLDGTKESLIHYCGIYQGIIFSNQERFQQVQEKIQYFFKRSNV